MCCQAQSCSPVLSRGRCVHLHAVLLLSFTWLAQVGSLRLGCHLVVSSICNSPRVKRLCTLSNMPLVPLHLAA